MPIPENRELWCRGYYELPGLEVQVGETQVLLPSHRTPGPLGHLFKLANGDLVTGTGLGCAEHGEDWVECAASLPSWRRSQDGGRTWRDTPAWPSYNGCQLPDGEILHLGGDIEGTAEQGVYTTGLARSTDNGYTHQSETATLVDVPELAKGKDGFGKDQLVGVVDHAVIRLDDGSLLAALYGKFTSDVKYRTFVVGSVDRGKTWPVKRLVYKGLSAYSSLAADKKGDIYLLFERGEKKLYQFVTVVKFNLAWLTEGKTQK